MSRIGWAILCAGTLLILGSVLVQLYVIVTAVVSR